MDPAPADPRVGTHRDRRIATTLTGGRAGQGDPRGRGPRLVVFLFVAGMLLAGGIGPLSDTVRAGSLHPAPLGPQETTMPTPDGGALLPVVGLLVGAGIGLGAWLVLAGERRRARGSDAAPPDEPRDTMPVIPAEMAELERWLATAIGGTLNDRQGSTPPAWVRRLHDRLGSTSPGRHH